MCLFVILACLLSFCSSKMYTSDSSVPLNPDTSCKVRGRYGDSVVGITWVFARHCQQRCSPIAFVCRHIRSHDSVWDPLGWLYVFRSCSLNMVPVFSASAAEVFPHPLRTHRQGMAGQPLLGTAGNWDSGMCLQILGKMITSQLEIAPLRVLRESVLPRVWSPRGCRLTAGVLLTHIHTSGGTG